MTAYPIQLAFARPARFTRLQLGLRVVVFLSLGLVGLSFGTFFLLAFLLMPAYAASRLSSRGAAGYTSDDAPKVLRALRWFIAFSAWLGLVVDDLPSGTGPVALTAEVGSDATPGGALVRVLTGLPSLVVLAVLAFIGMFVWLWAALSVLIAERVGDGARWYLEGLQRWGARLLAYQGALVDAYPPFSFSEDVPHAPTVEV
jgi:hypothetical protein